MYRHARHRLAARALRLLPVALFAGALAACDSHYPTGGDPRIGSCSGASLAIMDDFAEVEVGQTQPLHALLSEGSCGGALLAWESSNPDVATVSAAGVVEAHRPGYARITVRADQAEAYIHVMAYERSAGGGDSGGEVQPGGELQEKPKVGRHTRKRELLTWR